MVPCGCLQHIFNNHMKLTHDSSSSFLDLLGEPRLGENNNLLQPAASYNIDEATSNNGYLSTKQTKHHTCNVGMNAESLSMCTEGLGFESFDDVEHLKDEEYMMNDCHHEPFDDHDEQKHAVSENSPGHELKRSRMKGMEFPPPISSIGLSGKPWICLESYRSNGRFVLKEVRIPTQELLHARREDGRLKLRFVQSDDEPLYEDDGDDDDDDDECIKVDPDGDYACSP